MQKRCTSIDRIVATIAEALSEHGITQFELAELAGVGRSSIQKVERGERIEPRLVMKLATALAVLDLHSPIAVPVTERQYSALPVVRALPPLPAELEVAS